MLTVALGLVCAMIHGSAAASAPESNAAEFNVLTLNLHGYHPTGEPERWLQGHDQKLRPAESNLYFFSLEELRRGHERRLNMFRDALVGLSVPPAIMLLQEVGAGLPSSPKTCDEFRDENRPDELGKNVALQIRNRLAAAGISYQAALGCRGNVGWRTQGSLLHDQRVVRINSRGQTETVFEMGSDPYPDGTIVEGTAILVRAPFEILDSREWFLKIPGTNDTFFFQTARVGERGKSGWRLIANIHGGHKVAHFEEAVYMRQALARFVDEHPDRAHFDGLIVGGDFNAYLYRPSRGFGEVSTIPWEISKSNEFSYAQGAGDFGALEDALWRLNVDPDYKPWASLGSSQGARERVSRAVRAFAAFTRDPLSAVFQLRETFDEAVQGRRCQPQDFPGIDGACATDDRIDLLYATPNFEVENGVIAFARDDFRTLASVSDHPGVLLRFRVPVRVLDRAGSTRADRE